MLKFLKHSFIAGLIFIWAIITLNLIYATISDRSITDEVRALLERI